MNSLSAFPSSGRRYFLVTLIILCLFSIFTILYFSNFEMVNIPYRAIKRGLSYSILSEILDADASDFPTYFANITHGLTNLSIRLRSRTDSSSFNSNQSLRRDRVITYLITQQRIDELSRSLESLFRNYNNRFRFHVLLFHDAVFNVQRARDAISRRIGNESVELLEFHEVIGFTEFPPGFDIRDDVEKAKRENVPDSWRYPGYHHMCSFWWRKLFLQPRMATVEYYMRLDSDSTIRAPINYDLFEFVHQKGARYSYRAKLGESGCCAKYMYPFVYLYAKQNGLFNQLSPELSWMKKLTEDDLYGDRGTMNPSGHHPDQIYNNLEILHVGSFRDHPKVWHFIEAVWNDLILKRHGIYRHRWGDGPLRRATLNLFPHLYQHTHEFCDIDYHHYLSFPPSCPQPLVKTSRLFTSVPKH